MKWKCEQCWAKCELDLPDRNKITPKYCPFMGTIPAEWIKAKIVMGGCSFTEQDIDRLVELIIDRLNTSEEPRVERDEPEIGYYVDGNTYTLDQLYKAHAYQVRKDGNVAGPIDSFTPGPCFRKTIYGDYVYRK